MEREKKITPIERGVFLVKNIFEYVGALKYVSLCHLKGAALLL